MKCAIVGLGGISTVHANIILSSGNIIVAACDTDEQKRKKFAEKFGNDIQLFDNFDDMINTVQIDVIHICTPHFLHAVMTIKALNKNINVLCEKPLCISADEAQKIFEAEDRSNAMLGVCHQNRYNRTSIFVKEFLKDKNILAAHGSVVWSRDKNYYEQGVWRKESKTAGGGVIMTQALHTLDLVEWFCGTPSYVTASVTNYHLKDVIGVEDTAAAVFGGGADFTFFATNTAKCDLPIQITIKTDSETLTLFPDTVVINDKKTYFEEQGSVYGKDCYGSGHEGLIADFYDCVKKGKKFPIDGREGFKVVKLILALYKSNGERVQI